MTCIRQHKRWLAAVAAAVMLGTGNLVQAQTASAEAKEIFNQDGVAVQLEAVDQGLTIQIHNHRTVPLEHVKLQSPAVRNLKTDQETLALDQISAKSAKAFTVKYQLLGASDQNPNTPKTSLRILPRTGSADFWIAVTAMLFLLAGGSMVAVTVRRHQKGTRARAGIGFLLAAGVLAGGGLLSAPVKAADHSVTVPIKAQFTVGSYTFDYEGELTYQVEPPKVVTTVKTAAVPFEKKTVYDETVDAVKPDGSDNRFVRTAGVEGVKTTEMQVTYLDGEPVRQKVVSESVTTDPVDEVTVIGARTVEKKTEIPNGKIYTAQTDLPVGSPNAVLAAGSAGSKVDIYRRNQTNGEIEHSVRETAPVDRREGVGVLAVKTETVPRRTLYDADQTQPIGSDSIREAGADGRVEITCHHAVDAASGKLGEAVEVSRRIVVDPTDAVHVLGVLYTVRTEIPFEKQTEKDPALWEGQTRLKQSGVNGWTEKRYAASIDADTGTVRKDEAADPVLSTQTTPARPEITMVGTKPIVWGTVTESTPVPFETQYVPSDTLACGEKAEQQPGIKGKIERVYEVPVDEDGQPIEIEGVERRFKSETVTDPTPAVMAVGVHEVETKPIQPKLIEEKDDTQWNGRREVVDPGQPGKQKMTKIHALDARTGALGAVTETKTETVVPPADGKVKVGTFGDMSQTAADALLMAVNRLRAAATPKLPAVEAGAPEITAAGDRALAFSRAAAAGTEFKPETDSDCTEWRMHLELKDQPALDAVIQKLKADSSDLLNGSKRYAADIACFTVKDQDGQNHLYVVIRYTELPEKTAS